MKRVSRLLAAAVLLAAVLLAVGLSGAGGDSNGQADEGWWVTPKTHVPLARGRVEQENPYVLKALNRFKANPEKRYAGSPEAAAQAFFSEYASYFTGRPEEESRAFTFKSFGEYYSRQMGQTVVNFDIHYKAVYMTNARAWVWVDTLGQVRRFKCHFTPPEMPADVNPALAYEDALEMIRSEVYPRHIDTILSTEFLIYTSNPVRLAHRIEVNISEAPGLPARWNRNITIDAMTGEVLRVTALHIVYDKEYDVDSLIRIELEGRREGSTLTSGGDPRLRVPDIQRPVTDRDRQIYDEQLDSILADSVARPPSDTGMLRDEDRARRRLRRFRESAIGKQTPASTCFDAWFLDASTSPGVDADGDGYHRTRSITMIAESYIPNFFVSVEVWGTDSLDCDHYLGTTLPPGGDVALVRPGT